MRPNLKRLIFGLAGALTLAGPSMADFVYVTCQSGNVLSVIDTASGQVSEWSLPGKPAGIAVTETAVFTVSPDAKIVRRLDPSTGAEQARVQLDGGPTGIAVDPTRARVFISDWYQARIWVLSADDLSVQRELTVGAAPAGLALSDDGRFFASADRDADQISVFAGDSLELIARHPAGTRPYGLRFDPQGRIFVGNVGSDDVTVLDPKTGPIATVPVGDRPYGVAFAKGKAFVTNQYENTVSVIDLHSLQHETKIDVGDYPEGIDTSSDGQQLFVANWFDNTLSVIDASTYSVLQEFDTGDGPRAFGEFVLGGE